MSSSQITYATIGTSTITSTWIKSTTATSLWSLRGIYSRSSESAQSFLSQHADAASNATIFTDLQTLATAPGIQVIYIASPNDLHFAHAKCMLEGGKHVILEKPATSTSRELDELFTLAKSKGLVLLEAWRHLHEKTFQVLRRAVREQNLLGPLYGASLTYSTYSSRYDKVLSGEEPNIFSLAHSGGSLVDIGVYPIAAAVSLFGAPASARYDPVIVRTGVDGGGFVLLKYEGGFSVQISQSKIFASAAVSEIYGEKGTLRTNGVADVEYVDFVEAGGKSGPKRLGEGKAQFTLQEEAVEFARIVGERDLEAVARWEEFSRTVLGITEGLRRDNGIVFGAEKDKA